MSIQFLFFLFFLFRAWKTKATKEFSSALVCRKPKGFPSFKTWANKWDFILQRISCPKFPSLVNPVCILCTLYLYVWVSSLTLWWVFKKTTTRASLVHHTSQECASANRLCRRCTGTWSSWERETRPSIAPRRLCAAAPNAFSSSSAKDSTTSVPSPKRCAVSYW